MAYSPDRSSNGYGMALAGVVAGFLAARVLPPLIAQAGGRLAPSDPFDRLAQDHRAILDLIDRLEDAESSANRGILLLRLKRRLTVHALAEEDIVYPLLRQEVGEEEAVKRLYAEHGDIKIHLYVLETLVSGGSTTEWRSRVESLRELIAEHAVQEEEVEFPRLRRLLRQDELTVMAGRMQREKALVL